MVRYGAGLHRLSGYLYLLTGFTKGLTASLLSIRSHSLGASRPFMIGYGLWDCFSLLVAVREVLAGRIASHRRWMVRNFAIGAGSIWVRVFGLCWAACDLSFMEERPHP